MNTLYQGSLIACDECDGCKFIVMKRKNVLVSSASGASSYRDGGDTPLPVFHDILNSYVFLRL